VKTRRGGGCSEGDAFCKGGSQYAAGCCLIPLFLIAVGPGLVTRSECRASFWDLTWNQDQDAKGGVAQSGLLFFSKRPILEMQAA